MTAERDSLLLAADNVSRQASALRAAIADGRSRGSVNAIMRELEQMQETLRDFLTPTEPAHQTTTVRILVRVGLDSEGKTTYSAIGWGGRSSEHGDPARIREEVDVYAESDWTDGGVYSWVTAQCPMPTITAPEIQASGVEVDDG